MDATLSSSRNVYKTGGYYITQYLGAGAKSTAKDIKHNLSWWGISKIMVFTGRLMGDIVWEKLTEKKRSELTKKINRLPQKLSIINYEKPSINRCPHLDKGHLHNHAGRRNYCDE